MPPPPAVMDRIFCSLADLAAIRASGTTLLTCVSTAVSPNRSLRLEDVHGQHRALVGEVDLGRPGDGRGHGAGAVQHDVERDAGRILAVVVIHADGQHRLDGRAEIPADPERIFPADHDEPAAELLHPRPVKLHLLARHLQRGHVGEHEQIVTLQLAQRARQPGGAARFHVDLRLAQRPGQRRGLRLVALHEQHARVAPERGGGPGAVVFQAGVGGGEDFHLVGGETRRPRAGWGTSRRCGPA